MLGDADEPDALTHQTVSDNVVCMSNADLFNPEAADVQRLVAHNNQAFSDEPSHTQFCTGTGCTPPTPTSWDLSGNTVGAFAGNTWCSHTYPSP